MNVAILLSAPFYGVAIAFWLLAATAVASLTAVFAIPQHAIDYDVARGFTHRAINSGVAATQQRASSWAVMLANRALLVFALCGALFHLANAAMLGVVVQRASRMNPANAAQLAAACMIAAQIVMVTSASASLAGARANAWGRRPLFLQLLDGVGVGIFGALFPVVVADLARGSGRVNATQGGVGTIHSIGGILSLPLANSVVHWAGYDTAFLVLACAAVSGFALFWFAMPETRSAPDA